MHLSDLDLNEYNRRWQIEAKETAILIERQPIMSRVIAGVPPPKQQDSYPIEVRIGNIVLWHELEQAGVNLDEEALRDFVIKDLSDVPEEMNMYLWMARPNTPKRRFWQNFLGIKESVPAPEWIWYEMDDVEQHSNYIAILGKCYKAT